MSDPAAREALMPWRLSEEDSARIARDRSSAARTAEQSLEAEAMSDVVPDATALKAMAKVEWAKDALRSAILHYRLSQNAEAYTDVLQKIDRVAELSVEYALAAVPGPTREMMIERIIQDVCELNPGDYPEDGPEHLVCDVPGLRVILGRAIFGLALCKETSDKLIDNVLAVRAALVAAETAGLTPCAGAYDDLPENKACIRAGKHVCRRGKETTGLDAPLCDACGQPVTAKTCSVPFRPASETTGLGSRADVPGGLALNVFTILGEAVYDGGEARKAIVALTNDLGLTRNDARVDAIFKAFDQCGEHVQDAIRIAQQAINEPNLSSPCPEEGERP